MLRTFIIIYIGKFPPEFNSSAENNRKGSGKNSREREYKPIRDDLRKLQQQVKRSADATIQRQEQTRQKRQDAECSFHLQLRSGQINGDQGALPGLGVQGDGVAQAAADLPAQVEADAGGPLVHAAVAAGEAPVEDPGQVLGGDAHAVVPDEEALSLAPDLHMSAVGSR